MKLISKSVLIHRCWNEFLINKFVPEPDKEARNPYYSNDLLMKLYDLTKIKTIEASEEFQQLFSQTRRRKQFLNSFDVDELPFILQIEKEYCKNGNLEAMSIFADWLEEKSKPESVYFRTIIKNRKIQSPRVFILEAKTKRIKDHWKNKLLNWEEVIEILANNDHISLTKKPKKYQVLGINKNPLPPMVVAMIDRIVSLVVVKIWRFQANQQLFLSQNRKDFHEQIVTNKSMPIKITINPIS